MSKKFSTVTLPPIICYVCGKVVRNNPVYLGRNTYRHEYCYPGSSRWLKSQVGKSSELYQIFKAMKKLLILIVLLFGLSSKAIGGEVTGTNEGPVNLTKCFYDAGSLYRVPPQLLWSIAKIESQFNTYAVHPNRDGSFDLGIMQINSSWLPVLRKKFGLFYREKDLLLDPCLNIHLGAWVLADCIKRHGYTWNAVGCYNAKSIEKRFRYMQRVQRVMFSEFRQ